MSSDNRLTAHFSLSGRLGATLLVLISAGVAAVLAHLGIDWLGDYLLPHDTYDDIAHTSRALVSAVAAAGVVSAALALLCSTLDNATRLRGRHTARAENHPGVIVVFLGLVAGLALMLLIGMEVVDLRLANAPIDDLGDLLGGSIWLGLCVTLPIAIGVALCARAVARWALRAQGIALRVIGTWLCARTRPTIATRIAVERVHRFFSQTLTHARATSKRGPPLTR